MTYFITGALVCAARMFCLQLQIATYERWQTTSDIHIITMKLYMGLGRLSMPSVRKFFQVRYSAHNFLSEPRPQQSPLLEERVT